MDNWDTISAIATSTKEAGIGIVRISGDKSVEIAEKIFCTASGKRVRDLESHHAAYGYLVCKNARGMQSVVDEALLLIMRAPHSYTKEDVAEIQCHGGAVVLREVLRLTYEAGARPAERGEFTKRAFLNGRLDLTKAQAVMDIIGAKTKKTLAMASGHLSGSLSGTIKTVRQELLSLLAKLEASIDFPEDDIEETLPEEIVEKITLCQGELTKLLKTYRAGKILRDGLTTAIIGRPNVGKSSLLNALLKEERAIVTDIPGTTRDSIEEYIDLGGVPLKIIDTAGIRETSDTVERLGVERSKLVAENAALILALFDGSEELQPEDREILSLTQGKECIYILNKGDLTPKLTPESIRETFPTADVLSLSIKQNLGLKELERSIIAKAYGDAAGEDEGAFIDDERKARLLSLASEHLTAALIAIQNNLPADFISIDLKSAWENLGEILGEGVTEDIINEIFNKFCIGK